MTERARVAAVFLNRLKRSMRLQSDPTIIYGLVGGKGRLERPISRDDISQKTAYNTYRINGLPPTPIANPGREAIRAVLNPAATEEIYFVADGSGGHVFSKTLSEHSEKVKEWRKVEAALTTGGVTGGAAGQGKAVNGTSRAAETAKASVDDDAQAADDGGKGGGNETGKVLDAAPETRLVNIAGHVVPLPKAKPRQD